MSKTELENALSEIAKRYKLRKPIVTYEGSICKVYIVGVEVPDPEEGYRLLKKLEYDGEEELVISGDQVWLSAQWTVTIAPTFLDGKQDPDCFYRRSIEAKKDS